MQEKETRSTSSESQPLHPSLRELRLGVWRVVWETEQSLRFRLPGTAVKNALSTFKTDLVTLTPFFKEVYNTLGLWSLAVYFVSDLWSGFGATASLVFSNKVLTAIETSIATGMTGRSSILMPLATYVAVTAIFACITWASSKLGPMMEHRVNLHFTERVVEAYARLDYETSQGNALKKKVHTEELWGIFCDLLYLVKHSLTALSQIAFLLSLAQSQDEIPLLILLCLAKPLLSSMAERNLWSEAKVVYIDNPQYLHLRALQKLATRKQFKEEVITGGLSEHLVHDFKKTLRSITEIVTDWPDLLYELRGSPVYAIFKDVSSNLPLIFYAVRAAYVPQSTSLASLAMLQQTSLALKTSFGDLASAHEGWGRKLNRVKTLYQVLNSQNKMQEGDITYSNSENPEERRGMSVELCNVSFSYPTEDDQEQHQAIHGISFKLPPSSMVVIVGTNGSGKTTILKLLSGLYRATSGEVLIDGKPIEAYKAASLHESTAVLTQNHQLFPLSIAENIGIGNPSHLNDREKIAEAAVRGGAEGVIKKLKNGLDHFLERDDTVISSQPLTSGPLFDFFNSLEQNSSVSGGERQRLVASRTFMRIASNEVKLVMVDEPTSAMDPEGELRLFDGLREMRDGKTMIFVTHRFGHLTKHADLILCMKDGELVESGTHQSLIETRGEYYKLYNIQAQAFTTTVPDSATYDSSDEQSEGVNEDYDSDSE